MLKTQYDSNILVVEDESIIALTLEEMLHSLGYHNIDIAMSPESAAAKLETNTYDLAILDINLRNKYDGIELAAQMKHKNEYLPVIFLTGNSDQLTVSKAREAEPHAYLLKPLEKNQIRINLDLILFQHLPGSRRAVQTDELQFSRSFLNNHPGFIIRISNDEVILFTNNVISRITGKKPADYHHKTLTDSGLNEYLVMLLRNCLADAATKKKRYYFEAALDTIMGERTMFITVFPEMTKSGELIAAALLMQDVTDQKIATADMMIRNKKIIDSINYSKRIQSALLPDTQKLQHYIRNACIQLIPRDIVSGDFPWVSKRAGFVYVAVVDCTGHGVPGALLSFVIHFLLNEIVQLNEPLLPSRILEILHVYTKRTLKQHMPHIESNDGADIALCRLHLPTQELVFAGAHRPLLCLRGETCIELKGDRKPVGGEHYSRGKKRIQFNDHFIKLEKDDTFFIFSDGLTDQFGGSGSVSAKLGTHAVKEMLVKNAGFSAEEIVNNIRNEYLTWKGSNNALDDVLMICFKPQG